MADPATDAPLGSVEGSAAYSPMTLLMRYFNSQGIPPSADNIRRAIEANARNPGTVPGLVNTMPEDSSPAQPSTRVAPKSTADRNATGGPFDTGQGEPQTSAAPAGAGPQISVGGGPSVGEIATAIGLGGLLPAVLMRNRGTPPPAPGATAPPTDPAALFRPEGAVPATPGAGQPPLVPEDRGIIDYTQLEPPRSQLSTALDRAVSGQPNFVGDMPPVSPDAVGNYRPGPSTPVENKPLPFNSQSPRVAPTPDQVEFMRGFQGGRATGRRPPRVRAG